MYHSYLKLRAEKTIKDYVYSLDGGTQKKLPSFDVLNRLLYERLLDVASQSLETLIKIMSRNSNNQDIDFDEAISKNIPRLDENLKVTSKHYISALDEMVNGILANKEQIATLLPSKNIPNKIIDILCDNGDFHNHGKATMTLITDEGKVVFKPRNLEIDIWIKSLVDRYFEDVIRIPKVCNCGKYGFCEYIEEKEVAYDYADEYYEKIGGMAAILLMCGARDFHHENILFDGYMPVLVDLENILSPNINESIDLYRDIDNSIIYSCLFPQRVNGKQISILFHEKYPLVTGHQETFVNGFRKVYERILSIRPQLLGEMESKKSQASDMKIRFILRNTAAYDRLITKTREYGWMCDKDLEVEVNNSLNRVFITNGELEKSDIAKEETESILFGDIPYFYTNISSRNLSINGKIIQKDFFTYSAIDHMKDILNGFSTNELEYETRLLKLAIKRNLEEKSDQAVEEPERKIIDKKQFVNYAEEIFFKIKEEVITSPRGYIYFFDLDKNERSAMTLCNHGYVSGYMGIALFVAALSTITEKVEIQNDAIKLYEKLLSQLSKEICVYEKEKIIHESELNIGFDDGVAGMIFVVCRIYELTNSQNAKALLDRLVDIIYKLDLTSERMDMFGGVAGMVASLCNFDYLLEDKKIKSHVEKMCGILMTNCSLKYKGSYLVKYKNDKKQIAGMAHGQFGIAMALYKAGLKLGVKKYKEMAEQVLECEYKSNSELPLSLGYCSGISGMGMASLYCSLESAQEWIEKEIDIALKSPMLERDYLCCGNCSVIDFLIEAGNKKENPLLIEEAINRLSYIITMKEKSGEYSFVSGQYKKIFIPNLYYGAAGVGYEFLRIADPEKIKSGLLF